MADAMFPEFKGPETQRTFELKIGERAFQVKKWSLRELSEYATECRKRELLPDLGSEMADGWAATEDVLRLSLAFAITRRRFDPRLTIDQALADLDISPEVYEQLYRHWVIVFTGRDPVEEADEDAVEGESPTGEGVADTSPGSSVSTGGA